MADSVNSAAQDIVASLLSATSLQQLEQCRLNWVGRKGSLTLQSKALGSLPPEQRRERGRLIHQLRQKFEQNYVERKQHLEQVALAVKIASEKIDISLPGRLVESASRHPVSITIDRISQIFTRLGFDIASGPEVETEYYNFEALNIADGHPARDMHDTFYCQSELNLLLRTHTSPVQAHIMEQRDPPIAIICPGKVYRKDSDQTHTPMFHQVEGLVLDRDISFGQLKSLLIELFMLYFEDEQLQFRFRPSYFPFTEPSAEVDIQCSHCRGKGCKICSHTGYLEVAGCGMIHPNVLKACSIDSNTYTGFAFGMGVERLAMLKYAVSDLRWFFENRIDFLQQFRGV